MTTPLLSSASLVLGLVVYAKAGVSILKEYLSLALGVEIVECEKVMVTNGEGFILN
jgi:hypothetical protein